MGKQEGYRVERWGEYEIRVTAAGLFFAEDEGKRLEAKTLEGLKKKIGGPPVVLKVKAILFDPYYWSDDDKDYAVIDVYGISVLGNILYTVDGRKEKAGRRNDVRVFDQDRLSMRTKLKQGIKRLQKELDDLMDKWPSIERPKVEE